MNDTEQRAIAAMREHGGGFGKDLSETRKREICDGLPNRAEKQVAVDEAAFLEGVREAIRNHPPQWFME